MTGGRGLAVVKNGFPGVEVLNGGRRVVTKGGRGVVKKGFSV
jgi:hypothetical protein